MTTVELLRAARDQILTRGWIQGAYQSPHGFCLQGAVLVVGGYSVEAFTAIVTLAGCLPEAEGYNAVAYWNDCDGRTPEDVLALLSRAIAVAEEEEGKAPRQAEHAATVPEVVLG